jgi:cellulose synthase/poly-beta-1,6-N-acetylglucosamine synthase-like glycosyltransferase
MTIIGLFWLGLYFFESVGFGLFLLAGFNFAYLLIYRVFQILGKPKPQPRKKEPEPSKYNSFTVLIPLKREGKVIYQTFDAISELDYPVDKIQVLILVEDNDQFTLDYISNYVLPAHFKLVTIPSIPPFTKGRALNEGLRQARNDYVTVFDAESRPQSDQLKVVNQEINASSRDTCYQAVIRISNKNENLLTNYFAAEYYEWFENHLSKINQKGYGFGLGGNSFYIRKGILSEIGAWDAYNVTEDAELSARIINSGINMKLEASRSYFRGSLG